MLTKLGTRRQDRNLLFWGHVPIGLGAMKEKMSWESTAQATFDLYLELESQ